MAREGSVPESHNHLKLRPSLGGSGAGEEEPSPCEGACSPG